MRVLLVMDPFIKVPPDQYGGIERVVADLGNGLARRGHDITLWAAPGSRVEGRVEAFGREGEWTRWSNVRNVFTLGGRFVRTAGRFDVIHNFGRLAYLAPVLARDLPKVQTYMRTVNPANMTTAQRLGARRLHYTAVSAAIRDTARGSGDWSVIYNCAVPERYPFAADTDPLTAPLVFLGRLDRCKGAHHAIEVAQRLRRRLIIAGNVSPLAHEQEYFEQELAPRIDGELVTYVGAVNDEQKRSLLGRAAAMLMPIEWDEPFPVVLPESMLCGTPLIAFRRGGVPEGIVHGRTGFLCDTVDEMTDLVGRLGAIDRAAVRAEAVRRFSDAAVIDEYERLYRRLSAA
ncbi:MAG TPA: glycosyltransferase [Vicinamibacterales bacterium]|nr:glycosyltransferase [Vicinamibacterales bacterium]